MDAKSVRLLAELCALRVLQVENLKALLEVEVSRASEILLQVSLAGFALTGLTSHCWFWVSVRG